MPVRAKLGLDEPRSGAPLSLNEDGATRDAALELEPSPSRGFPRLTASSRGSSSATHRLLQPFLHYDDEGRQHGLLPEGAPSLRSLNECSRLLSPGRTENFPVSATVGAPLVKELKAGVSTPESWNDFKLPLLGLCLYAHHNLTNHNHAHHPCLPQELL
ncbi:hypothetical protein BDN71DRAFT_1444492 [Pleurotus eryngii]|uniref:Uncharacterized protein n=1 Tax=Pleurotus eryngii TaxID=5323 RepID=A0A9P6A0H8_PLEER|nr:hypothetical protein BDN71DRAFT_1444492 [Pleurotus eryngii]